MEASLKSAPNNNKGIMQQAKNTQITDENYFRLELINHEPLNPE